jgi:hypothetical protein
LIIRNKAFTIGAVYFQNVAAPDFPAIWVFVDFHITAPKISVINKKNY